MSSPSPDSNGARAASEVDEPGAQAAVDDLDGDVVPRLKRGKGIRINSADLFRIAAVAILLVGIVMLQRPCADGVASFVTGIGGVDGGAATIDSDGDGGPNLGELRMLTDQEIRDAFNGSGADKLLEREARDAGPSDR